MTEQSGTLYVVATPIGNLEDITLRAIRTLKEVDLIAAEDTRHTKKLLNHLSIDTKLISYYREREVQRSKELVQKLLSGTNIALVSDAGTPGISDPGAILIQHAFEANIKIEPIPGVSAVTTAMSCSGISSGSFLFVGFPPPKSGQRIKFLEHLKEFEHPVVFYESPRRIMTFLDDALKTLGDRRILWARELTKSFEDLRDTTLSEITSEMTEKTEKGEFVIIIHPGQKKEITDEDIITEVKQLSQDKELSVKDISKLVSTKLKVPRSKAYQIALEILKGK